MNQEYYQYFQWLQSCIQAQEQRIIGLEKSIQQIAEELKQLKEKPTIHVDTIEYKFDQLKVETLEGTLNIGLNPSDMQGIEDFAVKNNTLNTPPNPKAQMQRSMEIEDAIFNYLEIDLPGLVQDTGSRLNIQPTESYLSFIKEDIKKQLPTRIDFHLKSSAAIEQSEESIKMSNKNIIELIKKEIQNGVSVFLNHLPENVKGMKPE
ncbi:spore germination protein GerPC [Neobacillus sp. PS3-40]|uniref:spore germination protein GerPC n=1 Tax=Neobacillus sp. PS3-40 TaxID=3070679 RepID=UPI0027E117E2|nr:spore germination protein GerPC [Neobacillus sp. PS3-40]WML43325.1 spore germination protein GerPC [Neobacillus sp. PS3-40]